MNLEPKQDGQEQVVVVLSSGRSYRVPREVVERLFLLCADQAAAVVFLQEWLEHETGRIVHRG